MEISKEKIEKLINRDFNTEVLMKNGLGWILKVDGVFYSDGSLAANTEVGKFFFEELTLVSSAEIKEYLKNAEELENG